jgi:hypothetical protein
MVSTDFFAVIFHRVADTDPHQSERLDQDPVTLSREKLDRVDQDPHQRYTDMQP